MTKRKRPAKSASTSPAGPLPPASNVHPLRSSTAQPLAFDPATTLIRMPELLALTGLRRATVYKRLKDDPTFPRPVPLSASVARGAPVAWVLAEVQEFVRARIAARGEMAA